MDYNVEHFVLAYPVGYLKQAACLFIYLFKMKRDQYQNRKILNKR